MTDAVVVGSGPNGLAAAVTLAQAGVRVTVLEAADRIGGGTRSGELTLPGLLHDECSAFHPTGAGSPFLRSLPLAEHGLRWRWPQLDLAHPLDGGRAAVLSRSMAETTDSLGRDGPSWRRLFEPLARHFDALAVDVLQPVPHWPGIRYGWPGSACTRCCRPPCSPGAGAATRPGPCSAGWRPTSCSRSPARSRPRSGSC